MNTAKAPNATPDAAVVSVWQESLSYEAAPDHDGRQISVENGIIISVDGSRRGMTVTTHLALLANRVGCP